MSDRIVSVLNSPTFQGLAGLLIGALLVQATRIPGLATDLRGLVTAGATAALTFGAATLATVTTRKKVERIEERQHLTQAMLSENTQITAEAADHARIAAVKAETAADKADVAAQEAAQSRRMP